MTAEVDARPTVPVLAAVTRVEPLGDYWRLTVEAPDAATGSAAGQFVGVLVGPGWDMPLRRYFSILEVEPALGTVSFLVAVHSPGTAWLTRREPGDHLDLLGPLGRPFPLPPPGTTCLAVAGGHGGAGLYRLVGDSVDRGARMHVVLGAADPRRLFPPAVFGTVTSSVVAIGDGPLLAAVERAVADHKPDLAYACGPMGMLGAVHRVLARHGIPTHVATEARMACGIGVCMTCVLPVVGDDGVTRMTRTCVDGPVFPSDRVRWEALNTVPADCWGA